MKSPNSFNVSIHSNFKGRSGSRILMADMHGKVVYEATFASTSKALEALGFVRCACIEALIREEGQE